jgi:hypothetical protein
MAEKTKAAETTDNSEEFATEFARQIAFAKEELEKRKFEEERKRRLREKIAAEEERLRRYRERRAVEAKEKIKGMALEKETPLAVPRRPLPKLEAPIYRRSFPPLPPPPKMSATWPMPPAPRPIVRSYEATAPQILPVPTPEGTTIIERPAARPVIIRPTAPRKLDLGKLNPLISDETITMIQCDGANLPLKIIKERRTEEIDMVLSEEDIRSMITRFAQAAGVPVSEPIFTARINNLTLSSQISVFAGTKFVIRKG